MSYNIPAGSGEGLFVHYECKKPKDSDRPLFYKLSKDYKRVGEPLQGMTGDLIGIGAKSNKTKDYGVIRDFSLYIQQGAEIAVVRFSMSMFSRDLLNRLLTAAEGGTIDGTYIKIVGYSQDGKKDGKPTGKTYPNISLRLGRDDEKGKVNWKYMSTDPALPEVPEMNMDGQKVRNWGPMNSFWLGIIRNKIMPAFKSNPGRFVVNGEVKVDSTYSKPHDITAPEPEIEEGDVISDDDLPF